MSLGSDTSEYRRGYAQAKVDAKAAAHVPRRGSDVEAWIKRERDSYEFSDEGWLRLDSLLDDYRDHADMGTPLDQDVEGPHEEED